MVRIPNDRLAVRHRTVGSHVFSFIGVALILGAFGWTFAVSANAQSSFQQSADNLAEVGQLQEAPIQFRNSLAEADSSGGNFSSIPRRNVQRDSRSLNIVFAHDPGIGHYDGIVGGPSDIWNFVDLGTTAVDFTRFSDASPSSARLRVTRHDGEWGISGQSGIFHGYIYHNCQCADLETKVLDLAPGKYRLYVFAHGDAPDQNADIEVKVGDRSVDRKSTASDGSWDFRTKPLSEGLQFVSFDFKMIAGKELSIVSHRADSGYSMFNAIQIVPR